jgi:sortase (surface protein transpeptidase)
MDTKTEPTSSQPALPLEPKAKLVSPAIPMDDLLSDFIEKSPKAKKTISKSTKARVKKTETRLKHKLEARRQAKSQKVAAKKVIKAESKIKSKAEKEKALAAKKAAKAANPSKAAAKKIVTKVDQRINQPKQTDFTAQALTMAANTTATASSPTSLSLNVNSEGASTVEVENRLPRVYFDVKINKKRMFALIRTIIVMCILAISGYLAYDLWLANKPTGEISSSPVAAMAIDEANPIDADITSVSNQAWAAHTTPADQARYIYLPSINARARVMSVGVNSKGKIDASKNVNDVAWYDGSAKPGQEGQVLINGHSSFSPTYKAAFDHLSELKISDRVTIERGDGKKIVYRVVNIETIKAEQVDMKKILNVPDNAARGLTLMSCTGKFDYRTQSSDMRVIVYTIQE